MAVDANVLIFERIKEELKVEKNQIIAYSGNTGSSLGPHLHYEIRNTSNQKPLNPLLFGMDVKDTRRPEIKGLFVYTNIDNNIEPSLVIAHCVQHQGANSCCDGRLWRLDVGMSRAFNLMNSESINQMIDKRNEFDEKIDTSNEFNKKIKELKNKLELRKPQILKIPINNCNKSAPKIIRSEKHLPRENLRQSIYDTNDGNPINVYKSKSSEITFPNEQLFENNNTRGLEDSIYTLIGGMKRKIKKLKRNVRKHRGIIQNGGNKGRLKKGYKYTGKRTKTGLPIIKKTKK